MSTQVQYRRGTAAQNNSFVGALAEITVDTTNWTLRVQDGATAGGFALVNTTAAQTLANKTYEGVSVSVTGNVTGNYILGNGSLLTGIDATSIQNGTSSMSVIASGGNIRANIGGATVLQITSDGLINGQANGVGNIGNATGYFNTVFAKATSAQYADVAEYYVSDRQYPVGTVLIFGGDAEVTESNEFSSTRVAGTVSEQPAFIMNSGLNHGNKVQVALLGRVPCRVVGKIAPGDVLVSSHIPGVATSIDYSVYKPGAIIGKALKNYNSDTPGVIEIVVGRQ